MSNQIILDLDDVQADLFSLMRENLNEMMGVDKKSHDFVSFDITKIYKGLTLDRFFECLTENNIIENLIPIEGAAEATHALKDKGFVINVVTARAWHKNGLQVSADWLEKAGFHFDRIAVSCPKKGKVKVYRNIAPKFNCIVDDNLENILQAEESGLFKSTYLINMPWNNKDSNYVSGLNRFNALHELAEVI
jgi:5'(3')-deoxyribonucleotidase